MGEGEAFGSSRALRHYAAVMRRRWRWIAAGLVLGMVGGLLSSFITTSDVSKQTYFKATTTIVSTGAVTGPKLQQVAFLLQSAEVQQTISNDQGIPPETLRGLISAQAQQDVSAIDVTAIGLDPEATVNLADASARVLMDAAKTDSEHQYETNRDSILAKIDDLAARRADLESRIAKSPSQSSILKAELDSTINQSRVAYEQLSAIAAPGASDASFTVFQSASAVQINGRAFRVRYDANLNSRGALSGGGNGNRVTFSETDLGVVSGSSRAARLAIGGFVGLILGLGTALVIEVWDDRIRRRDILEEVTGIPVVAEIPAFSRAERQDFSIVAVDDPRSRTAEHFRSIRTSLLFFIEAQARPADGSSRTPVVLVTSPNPSEGKTTSTSNMAAVFAAAGSRTLVIDCDYRKPSISRYLAPRLDLEYPERPQTTRVENLWFMAAPTTSASAAKVIAILGKTIETWRDQFDIVFLDTPPMLATNDATDLLEWADAAVLVVRSGQTRRLAAERASSVLARFGAPIVGTIFNGCAERDMESYYGYGYYGSKYYGSDANFGTGGSRAGGANAARSTSVERQRPASESSPDSSGSLGLDL